LPQAVGALIKQKTFEIGSTVNYTYLIYDIKKKLKITKSAIRSNIKADIT
jgi:hypothetical protein